MHLINTVHLLLFIVFMHSMNNHHSHIQSHITCLLHKHHPDNEVYAWGNNSMGQCGQGNSTGPITKPKKVVGLDGVAIQQISAGTSHSLAWTALPRDRSVTSRVNNTDFRAGKIDNNPDFAGNINMGGREGEAEC